MRATASPLTAFEVSIARRRAAFTRLQNVGVHAQTHRAPGLTPFKSRFAEDPIETFAFSSFFTSCDPGTTIALTDELMR